MPYVGAGAGVVRFDVRQAGDFVDFVDNAVFFDAFRAFGWSPSAQVLGGVDIHRFRRVFLTFDGRYRWASGDLGSTWIGFDPLDLTGLRMSAGRENVRVRRFRRVVDEAGAAVSRPHIAATRLRLSDIKEASAKISPGAVEAALVETTAGFDLTGAALSDLDDAGVAGSVVDVLVALSYPDRFVVERTRDSRVSVGFLNDPFFLDYGFPSPLDGAFYAPYYVVGG